MVSKTNNIKISIGSFDLVKGVAMILIVITHMTSHYDLGSLLPNNIFFKTLGFLILIIGIGVNPVFFMIKGYTFKEKSIKKYAKKSFSECIIPYFYTMIAVAALFPIVNSLQYGFRLGAFKEASRWVLALLFGLHDPYAEQKVIFGIEVRACWVAWYLLTMFLSANLLNLIIKVKNKAGQIALTILSIMTGYLLSLINFTYFCLPQGLIAVGYCYAGYCLKQLNFFQKKQCIQIGVCFILLAATVWEALSGNCSLSYNIYKYGPLEIVGTSCAGLLLLVLSIYANQLKWKCLDWIKQIGVYTLWIMCIHSVELICFPWDKIVKCLPQFPLLAFAIEIVLKILIFYVSCNVLKKISRSKYRRMKTAK